jgi:hypothetical protein
MVVRLRDEASRMAADSPGRLLLREAASTIERLDEEARRCGGELARLAGAASPGKP